MYRLGGGARREACRACFRPEATFMGRGGGAVARLPGPGKARRSIPPARSCDRAGGERSSRRCGRRC